MTPPLQLVLGALAMTALIAATALLSAWPSVRVLPQDMAILKLSISHGGARNCRELTEAELAKLPPNMRRTEVCERRRSPVYLELDIDGETVFAELLPPSGIAGDGASRAYQRFPLPAGEHSIAIRLRDSAREAGFDYAAERAISLTPARNLAIDFKADAGGFVFY